MKEVSLIVAIALFLALLLFRFVRGVLLGRRLSRETSCRDGAAQDPELDRILAQAEEGSVKAGDALRKIERRAETGGSVERATNHCAAGHLAVSVMKRPKLAVGFYLRALRDDPTCVHALDRLQEILMAQKRQRRFERTCWEVLGRLDDDEVGSEIWIKCWSGLAMIYSANPRWIRRADAIRKLLSHMEADDEGADQDD